MMYFRRRKEQMSAFARARHDIQGRIVSGLIVLIPIGITFFILNFLFAVTLGLIKPLTSRVLPMLPSYALNIISICVLILVLYFVGLITTNILGRKFIDLGEAILARIPLVKSIYAASKQIVAAFSLRKGDMKTVALVEFPSEGLRSIGFITSTIEDEIGRQCYCVFVPTTPNPTTGFFIILPREKVFFTGLTFEEACKMLMSAGIVSPERISGAVPLAGAVSEANGPQESTAV